MHPQFRNAGLMILLALPTAACARCAPGTVGTGVGRLTMRNLGTLVELLNEDQVCGFESESAKASIVLSGPEGAMGTGTWRIEDCEIDLPKDAPYISEDCNGVQTRAWGRAKVTAERRISGIIAGDDVNPVIPGGPEGVTIEVVDAELSDFRVEASNSENAMTWTSARVSGSVSPLLAVDDDLGACSIVTSNAYLADVRYEDGSVVFVDTPDRSFDVDVGGSELYAVNGKHSDRENEIWGSIVVWGGEHSVPNDDDGLDPDYNPDLFDASYRCKSGIAQPVTFDCHEFLGPVLAQNSARITMRLLGRIATVLEADTQCGFSNPEVLAAGQLEGQVGGLGAATFTVEGCTLDYPVLTTVATDCSGAPSRVRGRLVVNATKRIAGRLTGNLTTPVVPVVDNPAVFDITVTAFNDFEVDEGGTAIRVQSGSLSGRVEPRVAANTEDSGACSYVTDIVRFSDVRWGESAITLRADEGTFQATIQQSNLQAVNGYWGGDTNMLGGSIILDNEPYQLPTDPNDDGLDPEYERAAFDAAWQCSPLELPARFECAFDRPLVQGAAQLGVQTFGTVASLIEANTDCGFSSPAVLSGVTVDGPVGYPDATAVFRIDEPCLLSYPQPTVIDTDCNGVRTWVQGRAWVTGRFTLAGIASGDPAEPIVPTRRDPAALQLSSRFEDFAVWTDPGTNILNIRSGRLSGTVAPRVAIDSATGACSITTPVAQIRSLRYDNAVVSLEQDAKRFDLSVARSDLDAINGQMETATNRLTGEMTVDGVRYDIPAEGDPILNPDYDQEAFDRSFACTENLVIPASEAACNMKQPIGEGVARLLILAAGTLASTVNADDSCGFEDFWTLISPDIVEGDDGEQGRLVWSIDDCEIQGSATSADSTDCVGGRRFQDGRYVIDAQRTVVGLRDTDYIIFDSIIPDTPNSVVLELSDAGVENYRIFDVRPNESDAFRAFEMEQGRIAAIVEPILGENASSRGTYDIATPVARFSAVRLLEGTEVTVFNDGKTFKVYVDSAQLEGFNGSYGGFGTNELRGQVVIDGTTVTISLPLDPDFEQQSFDESYACTTDLVATIPPDGG